jgi:hypothetical protein
LLELKIYMPARRTSGASTSSAGLIESMIKRPSGQHRLKRARVVHFQRQLVAEFDFKFVAHDHDVLVGRGISLCSMASELTMYMGRGKDINYRSTKAIVPAVHVYKSTHPPVK